MSTVRRSPPWISPARGGRSRMAWANATLVLLGVSIIAMGALHWLRVELSVVHQPFSYYVHGEHGWLLPLALAAFGTAALTLSVALRGENTCASASPWLVGLGAGMLVDAALPSDRWFPWQGDYTAAGAIHALAAVIAPPMLLVAMFIVGQRGRALSFFPTRSLNLLAVLYLVGVLASGVSLTIGFASGGSPPLIGIAERLIAIAAVGWMALVGRTLSKASSRPRT